MLIRMLIPQVFQSPEYVNELSRARDTETRGTHIWELFRAIGVTLEQLREKSYVSAMPISFQFNIDS